MRCVRKPIIRDYGPCATQKCSKERFRIEQKELCASSPKKKASPPKKKASPPKKKASSPPKKKASSPPKISENAFDDLQNAVIAAKIAAFADVESYVELAGVTRLHLGGYFKKPLTLGHWRVLGMLVSDGLLSQLQVLNIVGDNNDGAGVLSLVDGLRRGRLPSLRFLTLCSAHIRPQHVTALAPALTELALPSLEALNLDDNPLGDAGLAALLPVLRQLPTLKVLSLSDADIGDEGVASLVDWATAGKPKSLERLVLDNNQITDAGCAALAAALRGGALPALWDLSLDGTGVGMDARNKVIAILNKKASPPNPPKKKASPPKKKAPPKPPKKKASPPKKKASPPKKKASPAPDMNFGAFVDMCKDLGRRTTLPSVDSLPKVFQLGQENKQATFEFMHSPSRFSISRYAIASGSYGSAHLGTFGDGPNSKQPCIVKVQEGHLNTVVTELMIQTKMFCELRKRGTVLGPLSATIPKPLFTAIDNITSFIGMTAAEVSVKEYVREIQANQPASLCTKIRDILLQLCTLLNFLQETFKFVHGDMHGSNIMIKKKPFRVYMIDFGFSSATLPGFSHRVHAALRYQNTVFDKSLDLLMFSESLTSYIVPTGSGSLAHRMLTTIVGETWNRALACSTSRPNAPSSECRIYKAYKEHILEGISPYRYHAFYENAAGINNARTFPAKLQKYLNSLTLNTDGSWRPIRENLGYFVRANGELAYHINDDSSNIGKARGNKTLRFIL